MITVPAKVRYLAQKLRDLRDELYVVEDAYYQSVDKWAESLCEYKYGDLVRILGRQRWLAKIASVRAARYAELESRPIIIIRVTRVKKNGRIGFQELEFTGEPNSQYYCVKGKFKLEKIR